MQDSLAAALCYKPSCNNAWSDERPKANYRHLTGCAVRRKLASGPKAIYAGECAFVLQSLAAESPWKSRSRYDELVSGQTVYTYAGNDPLDKMDPSGRFCWLGFIGTTCTPDPEPKPTDAASHSVWNSLLGKAERFFKPAEFQQEQKPAEPATDSADAQLKKLKDIAKDKAKDLIKEGLKEAARKAGATDAQICEAEHCATAGPGRMSVCLMTYCGEELD